MPPFRRVGRSDADRVRVSPILAVLSPFRAKLRLFRNTEEPKHRLVAYAGLRPSGGGVCRRPLVGFLRSNTGLRPEVRTCRPDIKKPPRWGGFLMVGGWGPDRLARDLSVSSVLVHL